MLREDSGDQSYFHQKRSNYSKISKWTKSKLIRLVTQTNYKISSAAKILKINESTAKMIVRKFKNLDEKGQEKFFAAAQKEKETKDKRIQAKQKVSLQEKPPTQVLQSFVFVPIYAAYPMQFLQ